jgi:hypothetical protein
MKKTLAVLFLALSFVFTSVSFANSNSSKSSGSSSRSSNSSTGSGFKKDSSSKPVRKESSTSFGGFSQNQKAAPSNQYGGAFQKKADQSQGQKEAMNNWDKRNQPATPPSYENKPFSGRNSDVTDRERETRRANEARDAAARQREYAQRSAQNNGQVVVQQAPQSNNSMLWGLLAGMVISNNSNSQERPPQTSNSTPQPLPNSPADNTGAVTVMPSTASATSANTTPGASAQSSTPAPKPMAPLNTVEAQQKPKEKSSGFGTFLSVILLLGAIGAGFYFMLRRPSPPKKNAIRYKI